MVEKALRISKVQWINVVEISYCRMTILGASVSAGSVLGGLFSAHLLRAVGNVYLLLIGASLNVFAYAFTNIFLRESLEGAIQVKLNLTIICS